jgi:hypothetical protein
MDDFAMACLREVAKLDSMLEHTRYWYGQRMERLSTLAREELDEPLRTRFFSIVANGSPDVIEPPTSAQNYNAMKARAETAESELVRLRASATAGVPAPSQPEPVPCVLCTSPDYCAAHGCRQRPSGDEPQRNADFEAGWRTAANWMDRDDLIADIGSPAYLDDRAKALAASGVQEAPRG